MSRKVIYTSKAPEPIGPYSQAVMANDTLFISGQIALEPFSGDLITSNISDETSQVMENLGAILKAAEMGFENIVKCSIFIKNMGQFSEINEVYGSFFDSDPPARETVEVSCLPKNVNVEISCIAVK